ncbi:MAG: ACP S-malonyltransferase [Alphaproteobacteria bacterium]|nr:ACP S-malonyltransferase [Alphaproteobacteria bacterium]
MFVFPGQGTQSIGMGADLMRDFPAAKAVFDEVDEALHRKLSQLIFNGSADELLLTQNAQPAIMAVSMAVLRVLESEGVQVTGAVAGHSLGEYSALCAANALTLGQTATLLQARGLAMSKACEAHKGGMLALLGATIDQANELAKASGCYVCNDNAPGQVVVGGTMENIDRAKEIATKMNIRRAVPLAVAGAFHSPLMQSAADEMAPVLAKTKFTTPKVPVYFNVTAEADADPTHYADLLTRQIAAPVRWRELIQNTGATRFIECGPGEVLSGLIRRILPDAEVLHAGTSDEVASFLK